MQSGCWPQAQAAEALGVGDGCCPVHLLAPAKADGRFLPTHSIFIHMREDLCPIALCKLEKRNLLVSLSLFFFFFLRVKNMPPLLLLSTSCASGRNTILVGLIAHARQITWLESYKANSG